MEKPKTVPENIREAVKIIADALQRKLELGLDKAAERRLIKATLNHSTSGGNDARY